MYVLHWEAKLVHVWLLRAATWLSTARSCTAAAIVSELGSDRTDIPFTVLGTDSMTLKKRVQLTKTFQNLQSSTISVLHSSNPHRYPHSDPLVVFSLKSPFSLLTVLIIN